MEELGAEPFPLDEDDDRGFVRRDRGDRGEPRSVVVGPEGLGGPSWQEPASVEVGADLDRRGTERDVPAAFLTGIVLAGVALVALLIGDAVFAVVAGLVALVAQGELYGVMVKRHRQPATAVGLVSGALALAGAYFHGEAGLMSMLSIGILATFLWYLTVPAPHRKDVVGQHRAHAAGAPLDPGPRRLPAGDPHRLRDLGRRRRDRADVRLRHRGVRDRVGVGRVVRPATARARDQPQEVDRRARSRLARPRSRCRSGS